MDIIISDCVKVKKYTLLDQEVFQIFVRPGEVVELRVIGATGKHPAWGGAWARGTVSGYFDNHPDFAKALKLVEQAPQKGVYFTLQVIDTRLIGRAANRLKPTDTTTSDKNVILYRWLPVDIDPLRPSGISSSESELEAALELREEVATWILNEMKLPAPIRAISGNGAHLLFEFPEPMKVNEDSQELIKNVLQSIAKRFNNGKVTIDTSVFNPARIWKAYGTTARKGDPVSAGDHREARPHRLAYIDDLGRYGQ